MRMRTEQKDDGSTVTTTIRITNGKEYPVRLCYDDDKKEQQLRRKGQHYRAALKVVK